MQRIETGIQPESQAPVPPGPLAELVAHIAQQRPHPAYPELPMLDEARALWSRLGAQKRLRHMLESVPGNAGPLNSQNLVHRALMLMQTQAPGYLQAFMQYADTLAQMEALCGHIALPAKDAGGRRTARNKGR